MRIFQTSTMTNSLPTAGEGGERDGGIQKRRRKTMKRFKSKSYLLPDSVMETNICVNMPEVIKEALKKRSFSQEQGVSRYVLNLITADLRKVDKEIEKYLKQ